MNRVVVGMSGGVDSAVSALLLKRAGYEVVGVFMNNWEEKDENGVCRSQEDWQDVQDTCETIGIPYYSVNFAREYEERVFSHFLSEYSAGRTPNPDVLCNREIKFKAFLDYAVKIGAKKMATGHFVRTNAQGELLKGSDAGKEQSYFLYMLKQPQLCMSIFPVGGMGKGRVRSLAREAGLPVSEKKDSTGICFIGERRFKTFLKNYLPAKPGEIRSESGELLGEHEGLMYYTIGQRKGLGIGGHGDGRSWFVAGKDMGGNKLIVVQGEDHPSLFKNEAKLEQLTWVTDAPLMTPGGIKLSVKLRYRQPDQAAVLMYEGERGLLRFEIPQRAVTPGQSAVFYQGEVCLGGGIVVS